MNEELTVRTDTPEAEILAEEAGVSEPESPKAEEMAPKVPVAAEREPDAAPSFGVAEDIDELCRSFPELFSQISADMSSMNDFGRYRSLREVGLTPTEAFYATNGEAVTKIRLDAIKKREQSLQKSHVRVAVAETELPHPMMTEAQKRHARASLGVAISDSELERLWRRSQNK